jgi:NTE family protein
VVALDIAVRGNMHSLAPKLGIEGEYPILDLSGYTMDNPAGPGDFILKSKFGIGLVCVSYSPEDDSCVKKMVNILSGLVNDCHYIIMDLPSCMDPNIFQILNQSDFIHIMTSPEPVDLQRTRNLIERLEAEFNFQKAKIKVIINEYKLAKLSHQEQADILSRGIFATLPKIELGAPDRLVLEEPAGEYSRAIRRMARQLGDCLVGLALGVGVGYGFCHIGVLRVIEEEKIPIDVICGSSIGAIIAGLWATGHSSAEILEITKEFKEPKHIWNMIDLTFPATGFIKGNKLYNFLKRHFNKKTFYDVKLPLKVIASDIRRKEYRILDKGLLADAIMASCSMPGVFMPFKVREDMLLDGGIVSPLPCEPLLKAGVKKIIAVNVTPSREDILLQYEKLKEKIGVSPARPANGRHWFSPGRYLKDKFQVNILDLVFSSVEILQSEVARQEAKLADVVLHPDTQGLYWLELHKAAEFAKRGEEEARRKLDRIWELVNE